MPKQSRGFWVCDFCGSTFDGHDEARYHELDECPRRRPAHLDNNNNAAANAAAAARVPMMIPPLDKRGGMPFEYEHQQHHQHHQQQQHHHAPPPRRIPLMGLHEAGPLTGSDALSCQNIELFEAHDEQGKIGLRCLRCVDTTAVSPLNARVFPARLGAVGESVRMLTETHLMRCESLPVPVALELEQATRKRLQSKEEGGPAWNEQESNMRSLTEYCAHRCQQLGMIEKYPDDSGLIFRDTDLRMAKGGPVAAPTGLYPPGGAFPSRYMMGPGGGNEQLPPGAMPSRRLSSPLPVGGRPTGSYVEQKGNYDAPFMQPMEQGMDPQSDMRKNSDARPPSAQDTDPSDMKQQPMPTYDMPGNFPFYQEPGGDWICKFCSHLHPQYRDPQYLWSAPGRAPPPGQFIEQHLGMCRAYHQTMSQMPGHGGGEYQESAPLFGNQQQQPPQMAYASPTNWERTSDEQGGPPMVPPRQLNLGNYTAGPGDHPQGQYDSFPNRQRLPQFREAAPSYQQTPPQTVAVAVAVTTEGRAQHAMEFLSANDKSLFEYDGSRIPTDSLLVVEEDKLLLTDYFYWLMKQLRMVRFSEGDRKTRGGKREKIQVGYGGLQCVHCADLPNSRKFFWSNVDRLANSFAEIPAHVLKCRRCPQPTKEALHELKLQHPEQMARLPRGSQKVFFRRMWRRLHDEDPQPTSESGSPKDANDPKNPKTGEGGQLRLDLHPVAQDSPGTLGSEESILLLERPTKEAAKALADASMQDGPPSPSSRILLAIPEDKEWLSDTDCFVRRQLEVFCAIKEDVETAQSDHKYPVFEGQVGVRCVHCALSSKGANGTAVAYPFSISGIYESVREFQRLHLDSCTNLPVTVKSKHTSLKGAASLSSVLRKYYVLAARALGLKDTRDGIRPGGESVPLGSQAASAFSDTKSKVSEEMIRMKGDEQDQGSEQSSGHHTPPDSRKRRQGAEVSGSSGSNKSAKTYTDVPTEGV